MGNVKYNFVCDKCNKQTSTTIEARAQLGLCVDCDGGMIL